MTERELLSMPEYQAVLDQPLLDRPRLVLAQSLRTNWVVRAAHIRYEILDHRLTHIAPIPSLPSGLPLKRSLELKKRLGQDWKPPFEIPVTDYAYGRGFVEQLRLNAASLLADDMGIMRRFPVFYLGIEHCDLEDLKYIAGSSVLAQLLSLRVVANGVGDRGLAVLLESPHLKNLRVLRVEGAGLTMTGYEMVAEATKTTLLGLEAAFLSGNTIPDPQEQEPSYDSTSGARVHETVGVLPVTGRILEENLGYQKWLHWTSRFPRGFSSQVFERPIDMDETPLSIEDVIAD
jgi:hypothetical protein